MSESNNIKAIIFDCFGVLYPQGSGDFFKRHADKFNHDPTRLNELNLKIDLGQISRKEFFEALERIIGIPADSIQAEIDKELNFDQKLIDHIRKLKRDFKIGVLSNAGKEEIQVIYDDKIDDTFDTITVSYDVGMIKPDRGIYLACVDRLGVNPQECIFVDDSTTNLDAAKKLGMRTIYYPEFGVIPNELLLLLK